MSTADTARPDPESHPKESLVSKRSLWFVAALAALGVTAAQAQSVKVGIIAPMTGGSAN